MAQLSPSLPTQRKDAGLARELDVLEHLQQSLPDGFEIFHGVAWHTLYLGSDHHGEIDLVMRAPGGTLVFVEVRARGSAGSAGPRRRPMTSVRASQGASASSRRRSLFGQWRWNWWENQLASYSVPFIKIIRSRV